MRPDGATWGRAAVVIDCPFCNLFARPQTGRVILADDKVVSFLPLKADSYAHTLIAPKRHHVSLLDCPEGTRHALMAMVTHLAEHYGKVLGAEGFNLLAADGATAGQSIPHFHLHFLPRFSGDGFSAWPALPGDQTDLNVLAKRLRTAD